MLTYSPAANANGAGYASFTFQVQDDGGTSNGGVDTDQSANTLTIEVEARNDAPVAVDDDNATAEDTAVETDVIDNDTDVDDANADLEVKAGSLAATNGTATLLADGRTIRFTPDLNKHDGNVDSDGFTVSYTAQDAAGADSNEATLTIEVEARNDAPAGTDKTVTVAEDGSPTFTAADFGFSDANDPRQRLLAVKITTPAGRGSLKRNGGRGRGQTGHRRRHRQRQARLHARPPTPTAAGYASFTFQVHDDGGTANGGVDLDPTANTITIDVTSRSTTPRRAPTRRSPSPRTTRHTFTAADFGFTDPTTRRNSLRRSVTTLPGAGSLTYDGVAVTAGDLVIGRRHRAGKLGSRPAADANGTGYACFTFQVQDDGGTANGGVDLDPSANTITIDVTQCNDAPAGTDNTVTDRRGRRAPFAAGRLRVHRPERRPADASPAVKITTPAGRWPLTLDGVAVTRG